VYIICTSAEPDLGCHEPEKYFLDPQSKRKVVFPSLADDASVDLTVVVPAYNEEERCKYA
jgi:dolichyl-phosphate beta-glucosyltransferase